MWKQIKQWWAAEGALVGLQGVSDRTLADMGLEREDLRDRVHGRDIAHEAAGTRVPARDDIRLGDLRCVCGDA